MMHPDGKHTASFNLDEGVYAETFPREYGYGFRIGDTLELIYENKMSFGRRAHAEKAARKMHSYFVNRGRIPKRAAP
jgi:hypothetical protein